jgi:hypothetical protein
MKCPVYMIFIYQNWVSTWWQWSLDLNKSRKETAQKEKQNKTIQKHRIHNIENKHTKQDNKYTKNNI